MIEIRLDIKTKENRLIRQVLKQLPSEFRELKPEDIFLLSRSVENDLSLLEFKLALFKKYTKLSDDEFKLMKTEIVIEILKRIDIELTNISSDKNVLPFIVFNKKNYTGPFGDFSNVTFEQFTLAETVFHAFIDTKDKSFLLTLTEILYLNGKYDFKPESIDKDNPVFNEASNELLLAVYLVYASMRNAFFKLFTSFIPPAGSQESNPDYLKAHGLAAADQFNYQMYPKLTIDLAGEKFGNIQQTKTTKITDVFTYLNLKAREESNASK